MNGFIKLFCLSLAMSFLASCVPTEIGTVAQCGANEAYDAVKRVCYSTIVPHQPPTPTLKRIDLIEDQAAQEFILTYTDVDGDLATGCSIISRGNGIDDVSYNCQCQGGICTVKLKPDADFFGFTDGGLVYSLTDINGTSAGKSVAVYVTGVNDAPVSSNVAVTTAEDTVTAIALSATDIDLDQFYFVKQSDPLKGVISLNGATGAVSYTPSSDYFGTDSFSFKVCDYGVPSLCSANYTVSLTVTPVDDKPVAKLVSGTIAEETTGTILLDYSDVESDLATACSVTPNGSSVAVAACNCVGGICHASLTANGDFNGPVSFDYTVTANGLTSATSQINTRVTAVNDIPILTLTDPMWSRDEGVDVTYTQADLNLVMDEGGTGKYEASQSSFVNLTWVTQNPIPAGAKVVEQVDLYYNNSSVPVGSFTTNISTTYIPLGDGTEALDASKFKMVVKTKDHESGKLIFSLRLKDDGYPSETPPQAELISAAKTFTLEIIETNDPPVITAISDIVVNEGDEPYTQAFTIDEGPGDTEDAQNISFTVSSDNTNLVPANNIKIWRRHKNDAIKTVIGLLGGVYSIPTTYGPLDNVQDLNSGNYSLYVKVDPVDGMVGTANITLTATDNGGPAASASKTFAVTVNPVGGNHGGWTKINARGKRTDKLGTSIVGFTTAQVELGWNNFSTATSAANSNHVISGWRVFRRTTGLDYDWSAPLNSTDIASNTTSYTDTTVSEDTIYYYTVRPVDSSTLKLTIPTKEVFSEVRVFVPPANQVFVHRWMVNQEVCKMMLMTEDSSDPSKRVDPTNSFRCPYQGPGESAGYYDIGKDLVVDAVEVGCPYSALPACGVNGCIGIAAPTVAVPDGNYYYNRSNGLCYLRSAGAWTEVDSVAAYVASNTTLSNRSFLPPLVNISQEKANSFCLARSPLTLGGQFALPSRKEQIAYSSWDEEVADFQANEFELGQYINSSSKCNSSAASGVEAFFADLEVPITSYLYTLPGTKTSQIRSLYTGSQAIGTIPLTNKCQSRYGQQDVYGNVAEWIRDRFVCYPPGHPYAYTCDALVETIDNTLLPANPYRLADGSGAYIEDYVTADAFFKFYSLDGVRGPCQDNFMNDGICDSPMTSWAIDKTTNLAGNFHFPIGLPARTDYQINFPYSDLNDFLLPIGSTQGIIVDQLHNDAVTFNTYAIYNSTGVTDAALRPVGLAGVATGGSYLTTSDSGRYSMEFTPISNVTSTPASKTLGSNYIFTTLQENERAIYTGLRVKTLYPWWGSNMSLAVVISGTTNSCSMSYTGYNSSSAPTTAYITATCGNTSTKQTLVDAINAMNPLFLVAEVTLAEVATVLPSGLSATFFTPHLSYRLKQEYASTAVCIDFVAGVPGNISGPVLTTNVLGFSSPTDACELFTIEVVDGVTTYSQVATVIATAMGAGAVLRNYVDIEDFASSSTVSLTDLTAEYRFINRTMILTSQVAPPSGQQNLRVRYGASESITYDATNRILTLGITGKTSTFRLESLINSNPTLSGLIRATNLFLSDGIDERSESLLSLPTDMTSSGDFIVESNDPGSLWNELKISLIHNKDIESGEEYIEYDSNHIRVNIIAGVTTAAQIVATINAHTSVSALVTATLVLGHDDYLQGEFSNIFLENGVDQTPNRRTDIGFRCVAPVETGHYPADTFHTYPGY